MIIGLCGFASSGKDAAADYLVKHHGYTRFAFADALKRVAYDCNPWVPVGVGQLKELGMTAGTVAPLRSLIDNLGDDAKKIPGVRQFYQDWGVAVREHVGADAWVDAVLHQVHCHSPAVIADCRFPNEADAISAKGGYIIRVVRPGVVAVNGHVSERALDDWDDIDGTIYNDGTLDDLGGRVESVLTDLGIL